MGKTPACLTFPYFCYNLGKREEREALGIDAEERYEQLWAELDALVEKLTSPDAYPLSGPDGGAPDEALLAEKSVSVRNGWPRYRKKTAELKRPRPDTVPPYCFHEVSSMLRGALWLAAVPLALLALFALSRWGSGS